jgi:thymidine kinase
MFLEFNKDGRQKKGWIEVICGSMFSGKTEELLRRLRRAKIARQQVEIFKPDIDNRYDEGQVVSHDQNKISSTPVPISSHILLLANNVDVVGIDEAQFFDSELPTVCKELADNGVRVIIAGLDMDYTGKPFGSMPALLAMAEYITKVHAICMDCGDLAHISHRIVDNKLQVMVGEKESYVPLCRTCFNKKSKRAKKS